MPLGPRLAPKLPRLPWHGIRRALTDSPVDSVTIFDRSSVRNFLNVGSPPLSNSRRCVRSEATVYPASALQVYRPLIPPPVFTQGGTKERELPGPIVPYTVGIPAPADRTQTTGARKQVCLLGRLFPQPSATRTARKDPWHL